MRSEFEKLPQIESHLHNVVFDEGSNEYLAKKMGHLPFEFSEWFLNGSWTIYQHQQSKVDELQNRVDAAFRVLSQLNALDDEAHKRWKREACMFSQGESNAYEHAVRLLEQALKGGLDE